LDVEKTIAFLLENQARFDTRFESRMAEFQHALRLARRPHQNAAFEVAGDF
jgi:hypothetical protein